MPIDPSIALGVQPTKLVNPMEVMQTIQQTRAARAENDQRQFALQEAKQKAADDDAFKQAIRDGANLPWDQFRNRIATAAPEHLGAIDKAKADLDEKAALARKARAEADNFAAQAANHEREYIGTAYDHIVQSNGDPVVIAQEIQTAKRHFPESAGHLDQLLQVGATQGKDAFMAALQKMVPANITKTRAETANAVADLPKKTADAAIATAQAAHMSPEGLTPVQQSEATSRNATLTETKNYHGQEIGLQRSRDAREQAKYNATYGAGLDEQGKPLTPEAVIALANQNPAARMIANYEIAPPTARNYGDPRTVNLLRQVQALNPDYKAEEFTNRAPIRKAFTVGTQGQQITAMNTAIQHLDMLDAAAAAMKNGTFKPGNAAYNAVVTMFGKSAPSNYDTIKRFVDGEIEAVVSKGVPTVSGMKAQEGHAGSDSSPEAIQGFINTTIPLMGSKLNALQYQYKKAMGEKTPFDALSPEAKEILARRGFNPDRPDQKVGTTPPATAPAVHKVGDLVMVNGQQVKVTKMLPGGKYEGEIVK